MFGRKKQTVTSAAPGWRNAPPPISELDAYKQTNQKLYGENQALRARVKALEARVVDLEAVLTAVRAAVGVPQLEAEINELHGRLRSYVVGGECFIDDDFEDGDDE